MIAFKSFSGILFSVVLKYQFGITMLCHVSFLHSGRCWWYKWLLCLRWTSRQKMECLHSKIWRGTVWIFYLFFFWNNLVRQTHKSFWNILWPCYYCMFIEYLMAIAWSLVVNYLIQMCDQDRISPYNINTIWGRQVMRIKKNITKGIISWSNTKFSKLTSSELYGRQ